jgi:hypothetical protein
MMGYERLRSFINGTLISLDRWKMLSEDLEPKEGILSRRWKIQRYFGINGGEVEVVWKELCYRKA